MSEALETAAGADEALQKKLRTKTAHVVVVGLGYVGLPVALELGKARFTVSGIDVSGLRATGKLTATTTFDSVAEAGVVIICVPPPLSKTRDLDFSYILNSC